MRSLTILVAACGLCAATFFFANTNQPTTPLGFDPSTEERPVSSTTRALQEPASEPRNELAAVDQAVGANERQYSVGELRSGHAKRSAVGPEYDAKIAAIARQSCVGNAIAGARTRAASMCGFETWEMVEVALATEDDRRSTLRPSLEQLAEKALRLANEIPNYVHECWESGRTIEVWDPEDTSHDRKQWAEERGVTKRRGNLFFYTSTRAGDRSFTMHFDSFDFPALDGELEILKELKRQYWDAVDSLAAKGETQPRGK